MSFEHLEPTQLQVPFAVHLDGRENRISLTYKPTWRVGKSLAFTLPITPLILRTEDWTPQRIAVGAGLLWTMPLRSRSLPLCPIQVEARVVANASWLNLYETRSFGGELLVHILSKFQIGIHDSTLIDGDRWIRKDVGLTFGLTDLNGTLYWLARTIGGEGSLSSTSSVGIYGVVIEASTFI